MAFRSHSRFAFTLLEIFMTIGVLTILILMSIPAFMHLRGRAERSSCMGNLTGLYVAASARLEDRGSWPQVLDGKSGSKEHALGWYKAFADYKIAPQNWVCPSIQRQSGNPVLEKAPRLDYIPTYFGIDSNPRRYGTHPWFSERGDMHGVGNLIVFANGEIRPLNEVVRSVRIGQ